MAELDIAAFLRARLDERERAALFVLSDYAQHEAAWTVPSTGVVDIGEGSIADETILTGDGPLADFIADNDPEFVLADVEAKRQLVELHKPVGISVCDTCHSGWTAELNPADFPCTTLRLLALPYAGHPDYREDWRP